MSQPRTLKRSLGLSMATALFVGNMIGSGVFLPPASPASASGPVAIVARLLTGGPYVYARRAFGAFVGFQTAWACWIAPGLATLVYVVATIAIMGAVPQARLAESTSPFAAVPPRHRPRAVVTAVPAVSRTDAYAPAPAGR